MGIDHVCDLLGQWKVVLFRLPYLPEPPHGFARSVDYKLLRQEGFSCQMTQLIGVELGHLFCTRIFERGRVLALPRLEPGLSLYACQRDAAILPPAPGKRILDPGKHAHHQPARHVVEEGIATYILTGQRSGRPSSSF